MAEEEVMAEGDEGMGDMGMGDMGAAGLPEASASGDFNPAQIAQTKPGPLQHDPKDSETLDGEFTQEEFSSLFKLLQGLSDGSDSLVDDEDGMGEDMGDEFEEGEEVEAEDESVEEGGDDDLAEALQKVAAQLRAKSKKSKKTAKKVVAKPAPKAVAKKR
jgi:hypothetical protein